MSIAGIGRRDRRCGVGGDWKGFFEFFSYFYN